MPMRPVLSTAVSRFGGGSDAGRLERNPAGRKLIPSFSACRSPGSGVASASVETTSMRNGIALRALCAGFALACLGAPEAPGGPGDPPAFPAPPGPTAPGSDDPSAERIRRLEADYEILRDGSVRFEQRLVIRVAGEAIHRGPVLNYLTAFRGPGGLVLDSELEIEEATRDGSAEPFRIERRDGFVSLYLGSSERELEHRDHAYVVRGRMEGDWRRGEGVLSTAIDLLGPLPALPLDALEASLRLPEGVPFEHYAVAVTGASEEAERYGPAYRAAVAGSQLTLRTTAPLAADRSAFVNVSWPSATFATRSQWPKVLKQHPRIPLAAGSAVDAGDPAAPLPRQGDAAPLKRWRRQPPCGPAAVLLRLAYRPASLRHRPYLSWIRYPSNAGKD